MNREGCVPVHAEEGGVSFEYDIQTFNFANLKPSSAAARSTDAQIPPKRYEEDVSLAHSSDNDDAVPEFLGFDDDNEDQPEAAAAAPSEPGPPPSIAHDLLRDYVSMGLLEDSSKPAAVESDDDEFNAPPPELPRVPWLDALKGISSPLLRLHQEIVEFCRFVAPSDEEAKARQDAIARIQAVVQSIWPNATVEVFGSFATGLYLPTSDVDAVILNSGCTDIPSGLKALATALSRREMAKNMQLIAKARVPIIKFEEAESGYAFDISFDVANGPEAAENVRGLMDSLPPMRPLVTVIKVFLQQRELNEVYSGGLGSYAVLVMVAGFLQTHASRLSGGGGGGGRNPNSNNRSAAAADTLETNLGVLLVDFFRLYGRALNNTFVGVSCRRGGSFFSKRSNGFFQEERPYLLAIEDPNDPENDLGKNSFNASRARSAFDYAYSRLTAASSTGESLLHRIIRLDPALFLREPKPHPVEEQSRKKQVEQRERLNNSSNGGGKQQRVQESRGRQRESPPPAKKQKKKHRERSASDDDSWGNNMNRKPSKQQQQQSRGPPQSTMAFTKGRSDNSGGGGGGRGRRKNLLARGMRNKNSGKIRGGGGRNR